MGKSYSHGIDISGWDPKDQEIFRHYQSFERRFDEEFGDHIYKSTFLSSINPFDARKALFERGHAVAGKTEAGILAAGLLNGSMFSKRTPQPLLEGYQAFLKGKCHQATGYPKDAIKSFKSAAAKGFDPEACNRYIQLFEELISQ